MMTKRLQTTALTTLLLDQTKAKEHKDRKTQKIILGSIMTSTERRKTLLLQSF